MTDIKFNKWILDLPEYIPGKTIEEIKDQYNLKQVHKLASNENILGPAPKVIQFLKNDLEDLNYYPDSYCRDIRIGLSRYLDIEMDSIILGNGTDQIIEMICDAILDNGKNIVISDPTFLAYEKSALKCNAGVKKVPLKSYRQDIINLLSEVDKKTAIVFLTSPHNPTGSLISKDEYDYLLHKIPQDILVVLDEAYYEYVDEDERINTLQYLDEYSNVILLRTFSKIYGLAGLRIGYGISRPQNIVNINKLAQPFNVNMIAQKAALIALQNQDYIREVTRIISKEKIKFYDFFDSNGINYLKSYANFILIETKNSSQKITEDLLKEGFIVRLGDFLGVNGYIRVSISTPEINDKFLDTFIKIYNRYNP